MKINQKELELKTLKCITAFENAVFVATEKSLKEHHFMTKEPGTDISLTGKLFTFATEYATQSGGYRLTETVLESLLIKKGASQTAQNKVLKLWYEVESSDATQDDFPQLLQLMKDRYCVKLMSEMMDANTELVSQDRVKEAISKIVDYVNIMTEEQDEFQKDKVSFDMSQASSFFFKEVDKRLENPDLFRGINCGLENLDSRTFGFLPSQLVVLLAPSAGGKSVQLLNWADYANRVCKKKVLYFSFEMSSWLCMLRHASLCGELNYDKLKSLNITGQEKMELEKTFKIMESGPYFEYVVSIEDPTPEFIEQKIREISSTKGMPDLVVADYIGNMTTRGTYKNAKHWEKNGDAAEGLFKIAKRYNIPIYTAQQINRDAIKENRKNKESGKSSAYYQDAASGDQRLMHLATYVVGLEPNKEDNTCWYHPVKMRDAYFNPFPAKWIPEYNKVVDLTESQQSALQIIKTADGNTSAVDFTKPTQSYVAPELDLSDWSDDF